MRIKFSVMELRKLFPQEKLHESCIMDFVALCEVMGIFEGTKSKSQTAGIQYHLRTVNGSFNSNIIEEVRPGRNAHKHQHEETKVYKIYCQAQRAKFTQEKSHQQKLLANTHHEAHLDSPCYPCMETHLLLSNYQQHSSELSGQ